MLLYHKFIDSAKIHGKKIAVYDQATGKDISYENLLIASLIFKNKLKKFPEKYIGVMIPPSIGCIATILGLQMCEKTPVMINYSTGAMRNSEYAQEKINFRTIIVSKKLLVSLGIKAVKGMVYIENILKEISSIDKIKAGIVSKLPGSLLKSLLPKKESTDDAVILFTSGSEKDPKAVQLSHKNILSNVNAVPKTINTVDSDIYLANLPFFHVFGLTVTMWLPLSLGCSIVSFANPLDYKSICKAIKNYKISVMVGTPTFYHGYLRRAEKGDFDSLRYAIAGADKLSKQVRDEYLKFHNVEILEGYGTTETSPVISFNSDIYNRPGSVGKALPGVQVKIIDRETDKDLDCCNEGKIIVKGDLVMTGYFNDIEETSLRIHNGWYDTGDMGVIDEDGYIWHRGRLKRFVKIAGEMISLVKVESVLEKYLPDETMCCVVDVPNPVKGADIVAVVTTKEINSKKIIKQMSKELSSMSLPKEFYVLDEIPIMPSGKVNFREVAIICRKLHKKKRGK